MYLFSTLGVVEWDLFHRSGRTAWLNNILQRVLVMTYMFEYIGAACVHRATQRAGHSGEYLGRVLKSVRDYDLIVRNVLA